MTAPLDLDAIRARHAIAQERLDANETGDRMTLTLAAAHADRAALLAEVDQHEARVARFAEDATRWAQGATALRREYEQIKTTVAGLRDHALAETLRADAAQAARDRLTAEPSATDLIHELRDTLGLWNGARPESPKAVWDETLRAAAQLRAEFGRTADAYNRLSARLAAAVAAERERCAQVAESLLGPVDTSLAETIWGDEASNEACTQIAAAIRRAPEGPRA